MHLEIKMYNREGKRRDKKKKFKRKGKKEEEIKQE